MKFDCDLFVIGGGSGGVRAARVVAAQGYKVSLAEGDRMGGTCVIRGCVPKKLMVYASKYQESFDEGREYGWDVNVTGFSWEHFRKKLDAELARLEKVYRKLLETSGVRVFNDWAQIKDPHTVLLGSGEEIRAKTILIAVGGQAVKPDITGSNFGMISDDVFGLNELPKSLLIVGGGYIASEFSCIFNGLGVDVTQIYRGQNILRGFDDEASQLISETMVAKGIKVRCNENILKLSRETDQLKIDFQLGSTELFDDVLFATGRKPNTQSLGLHNVGIKTGISGEILVDKYSQTDQPSIFAIGDVTNRINLTPVAINEAMAFAQTMFFGNPTPVDHHLVPSAVFTQPELGSIGLSEKDAVKIEPILVYESKFRSMQKSFISKSEEVLMKLIVSKQTNVVIGCHIVAPDAAEMIQLASIAIKMGATKDQFDQVCAVHPTMAEELVTMRNPINRG